MPKIKICGLFRDYDIDFVNEAMPDYIGFVFAKSHRQITKEQASVFRKRLNNNIISVGVFVDNKIEEIQQLYNDNIISVAQLHGNEDSDYILNLRKNNNLQIIKAIDLNTYKNVEQLVNINADFLLFDSGNGGTGKTFNWDTIPKIQKSFFLAGGLDINNIGQAIKTVNPYAVDLSTGVETNGVKDKQKILNIVRRVKNV
ncbi:MAG: phosphoribosylanthranilate isomerase [Endomicrobiia bacterium]|nr:phosphoribosylanthranilate isomerase [Endomicrobiaceae bacterium]